MTPTADNLALIKALVDFPGDLAARLAMADQLEEQGEDRFATPLRCAGWWTSDWDKSIRHYDLCWHVHPGDYQGGLAKLSVTLLRRKEAPCCDGITIFHGRIVTPRTPGPCTVLNHLTAGPQTRWLWLCLMCRAEAISDGGVG